MFGQLQEIGEQDEQLVVVALADGLQQRTRQDLHFVWLSELVASARVIERQRIGNVMVGQEALQVAGKVFRIFQKRRQASGGEAVTHRQKRCQALAPAIEAPLLKEEKPRWDGEQRQREGAEPGQPE